MSASDAWSNNKELNVRQRLALKFLMLAIKLLEPYRFAHQYEQHFKEIDDLIMGRIPEITKESK